MNEQTLFYLAFASQVFLISYLYPRTVLGRMRHVLATYPPSEYPRLYARSKEHYERAASRYQVLNAVAFLVGIALLSGALLLGQQELLNWDNISVVTLYFLLQSVPFLLMARTGFVYFSPGRRADSRSTRRARLEPRYITDLISPALLGVAVGAFAAFVGLIVHLKQFDYPWFGGYANLVGIAVLNVFFAAIFYHGLYGKSKDPYESTEARMQRLRLTGRVLVLTSIVATVYVSMSIILRTFEMPGLLPIMQSLYFQLLALLTLHGFRVKDVDFEVYREDPATA
jgi:hypothetical protein